MLAGAASEAGDTSFLWYAEPGSATKDSAS